MLKLDHITKVYQTKEMKVEALKGISLAFRKNEFVSILGPSGCGKTTTLNIIGGLDHATDGDLMIGGVSTKKFTDHDWDVYRNHRIGFIFQSYNLIPQENIQENVELALAISGLKKEERQRRAREALDQVGLQGMYSKKPNELSGGQCQRVAIARALVNEPDILLADEPTGALDSVTSVQIMDLIKKISEKKLVIMVTHNPDLAKKYSTRIINLLDGRVVGDSNPYSFEEEAQEYAVAPVLTEEQIAREKAKMSWWTAFKLSAKNLWVKVKRTTMIVLASSIGIVGVSAVLAVSQGVTGYITGMQDDMLSGNPVTVEENAIDLSNLMQGATASTQTQVVKDSWQDGKINVQFMIERLINMSTSLSSATIQNNITEDYVQFVRDMPSDYYRAMAEEYGIDVRNNLYTHTDIRLDGYSADALKKQKYSVSGILSVCATILENLENGKFASYTSMIGQYANGIGQCLEQQDYVLSEYNVVSGRYATGENELMLVLNHRNELTDFNLTLLGYYSQDEFANAIYHYVGYEDKVNQKLWQKQQSITVDELIGKEYTYYPNDSIYSVNPAYDVSKYQLKQYNYSFVDDGTLQNGVPLKVVGILTPKDGVDYGCMDSGLYYTPAFAKRYLADNLNSTITTFIRKYLADNPNASGYTSSLVQVQGVNMISGIGYDYRVQFPDGLASEDIDPKIFRGYGLVGNQNALQGILAGMAGSSSGSSDTGFSVEKLAVLGLRNVGGETIPGTIKIYPNSFNDKDEVTNYLDQWKSDKDITLSTGKVLTAKDRDDIKYTDNLALVISMINNIVNIVTIALVCFTALSLVVSTVMIGIITYVSVMERVKEIGVIRSLGGRKRDVSHLFNAETAIIGVASGIFGLLVTYLIELILNLAIGIHYGFYAIANLSWWTALIVFVIAVLLTMIAGILPARSAARQDPVVALRSE